jgi:MFS transporter, AAHS family, 4-hydroxybenzoate transporter
MPAEAVTASAKYAVDRLHLRVAWLCGVVLFLEGYDIAAVGYAVPSLVDAWRVAPSVFTQALTAGNVGLLLGSLCAGLLGDRLGRKPVLIGCVLAFGIFSLVTAFAGSPLQLAGARFLTGLGLGGGIPLTIALASDFAPPMAQGRLVILMTAGVAIGFTVGGWLASQVVRFLGWPGIFAVGGVLPLAIVPLLALRLPESVALRATTRPQNPVTALFRDGLAPSTALLWAMNLLNLLSNYFILLWMPAILHGIGVSPSWAIFGTTMYGLGTILGALLTAPLVDRLGVERVLTWVLAFGALCVLSIGLFDPPFGLFSVIICGAGIGVGGCQPGINSLSGQIYPPMIRSTGAGWALGSGRVGCVALRLRTQGGLTDDDTSRAPLAAAYLARLAVAERPFQPRCAGVVCSVGCSADGNVISISFSWFSVSLFAAVGPTMAPIHLRRCRQHWLGKYR